MLLTLLETDEVEELFCVDCKDYEPKSIIALAAKRKSLSAPFLAARQRKLPRAAMDTRTYSVATASIRRAMSVGCVQKKLLLGHSEKQGIIARHVDGRKSRSCARTRHGKENKPLSVTMRRPKPGCSKIVT